MTNAQRLIPKRRFKEFVDDGDWEELRLGQAFNQTVEHVNPQVNSIELWSLTVEDGLTPKTDRYVRDFLVRKEDKYKLVRPGDIVYNPMNMTLGAIGYNNMSKAVAVSGYYITMKPTDMIDGYYIKTSMQRPQSINLYKMNATGSLIEKQRVQYPTFAEIMFKVPKAKEQTKIGTFFKQLDDSINLQQRKLEKAKSLKSAYLSKMFPKEGEEYPELRFAGFSEAWEQRELGALAEFNPKADLPDTFKYVDLESVVGTEMIAHRVENKATAPSRAQRLARQGDLFYQTVRPYQKNNYLYDKPFKNYVFSTGYAQMRPRYDGYFLLCLVQTEPFVKAVLDKCTGTSYPAINSNDLADMRVSTPPDLEEENALGQFFRHLDNLIALHQRKLDKLKDIKKAYLNEMFV